MTEVILHEWPLTDEAVRNLARNLKLPHVMDFGAWSSPPERTLNRYLPGTGPLFHWHQGSDHWVQANPAGDVIRHYEIIGLSGEREAKLLRQRARRAWQKLGRRLEASDIQALLAEVVERREERSQAETFECAGR